MSGTLTLQATNKNSQLNNFTANLNSGTIKFYTTGGSGGGGTLVATVTFGNPAFGNASGGSATANAITSGSSVAAGTMVTAEFYNSSNSLQGTTTVGTTGSGSGIEFSNNVVSGSGVTVSISSLVFTHS